MHVVSDFCLIARSSRLMSVNSLKSFDPSEVKRDGLTLSLLVFEVILSSEVVDREPGRLARLAKSSTL